MKRFKSKLFAGLMSLALLGGLGFVSNKEGKVSKATVGDTVKLSDENEYKIVYETGFEGFGKITAGNIASETYTFVSNGNEKFSWTGNTAAIVASTSSIFGGTDNCFALTHISDTEVNNCSSAQTISSIDGVKAVSFSYKRSAQANELALQYSNDNGQSWTSIPFANEKNTSVSSFEHIFDTSVDNFCFKLIYSKAGSSSRNYIYFDNVKFYKEYSSTGSEANLETISLSGYKTDFAVGDSFTSEGLEVTGHYDNSQSSKIDDGFEVSTPDMSTPGEKTVTVSVDGVSATYSIMVYAAKNSYDFNSVPVIDDKAVNLFNGTNTISFDDFTSLYVSRGTSEPTTAQKQLRAYKDAKISFESTKNIAKIVFNFSAWSGTGSQGTISTNNVTYSDANNAWSGLASFVEFNVDANVRIDSILVYYMDLSKPLASADQLNISVDDENILENTFTYVHISYPKDIDETVNCFLDNNKMSKEADTPDDDSLQGFKCKFEPGFLDSDESKVFTFTAKSLTTDFSSKDITVTVEPQTASVSGNVTLGKDESAKLIGENDNLFVNHDDYYFNYNISEGESYVGGTSRTYRVFTSSNEDVAKINYNGKITTVGEGSVKFTISLLNGQKREIGSYTTRDFTVCNHTFNNVGFSLNNSSISSPYTPGDSEPVNGYQFFQNGYAEGAGKGRISTKYFNVKALDSNDPDFVLSNMYLGTGYNGYDFTIRCYDNADRNSGNLKFSISTILGEGDADLSSYTITDSLATGTYYLFCDVTDGTNTVSSSNSIKIEVCEPTDFDSYTKVDFALNNLYVGKNTFRSAFEKAKLVWNDSISLRNLTVDYSKKQKAFYKIFDSNGSEITDLDSTLKNSDAGTYSVVFYPTDSLDDDKFNSTNEEFSFTVYAIKSISVEDGTTLERYTYKESDYTLTPKVTATWEDNTFETFAYNTNFVKNNFSLLNAEDDTELSGYNPKLYSAEDNYKLTVKVLLNNTDVFGTYDLTSVAVSDIEVNYDEVQTKFLIGQEFNYNGLKVTAKTESGDTFEVPSSDISVTCGGFKSDKVGRYRVTVSYGGITKQYYVSTVLTTGNESVEIDEDPIYKTSFINNKWESQTEDELKFTYDKVGASFDESKGVSVDKSKASVTITSTNPLENINKVTIKYAKGSPNGIGSIELKIGDRNVGILNLTSGESADLKSFDFVPETSISGKVEITVKSSSGAIYLSEVEVNCDNLSKKAAAESMLDLLGKINSCNAEDSNLVLFFEQLTFLDGCGAMDEFESLWVDDYKYEVNDGVVSKLESKESYNARVKIDQILDTYNKAHPEEPKAFNLASISYSSGDNIVSTETETSSKAWILITGGITVLGATSLFLFKKKKEN